MFTDKCRSTTRVSPLSFLRSVIIRVHLWLILFLFALTAHAEWRVAKPGWEYSFPSDHASHPGFKTEWWYFTGNLTAKDGRAFGYQLTFFRQGILPGDEGIIPLSRFVTRDVKFAHFTVSDFDAGKFHFFQKLSRGAYGEAGFGQRTTLEPQSAQRTQSEEGEGKNSHSSDSVPSVSSVVKLSWIDDWSCELTGNHAFRIRASKDDIALDLQLASTKPPILHGTNGLSQKAAGEGRASHYYSLTRLASEGILRIGSEEFDVNGLSWFDHEWATNQLAENQIGWDWFSLQFDDGSELMLFQLRTKDGTRDPFSSGTFIDPKGKTTPITDTDFSLEPSEPWKSPESGGSYPTAWRIAIPRLGLELDILAALKDQELRLKPIVYWEGAIRATGTASGRPIEGSGYLEMTGYAGPIAGMQSGR